MTEIDLQLHVWDIMCLALTFNVKQLYEQMADFHISLVSETLFHFLACGSKMFSNSKTILALISKVDKAKRKFDI